MVDQEALLTAVEDYADALLGSFEIGPVLYRLTDQVMAVVGVDGAGVSLAGEGEALAFIAATDAQVAQAEQHQVDQQVGPCYHAFATGEQVAIEDVKTASRWPEYRSSVLASGFRAVAESRTLAEQLQQLSHPELRPAPFPWGGRAGSDRSVREPGLGGPRRCLPSRVRPGPWRERSADTTRGPILKSTDAGARRCANAQASDARSRTFSGCSGSPGEFEATTVGRGRHRASAIDAGRRCRMRSRDPNPIALSVVTTVRWGESSSSPVRSRSRRLDPGRRWGA